MNLFKIFLFLLLSCLVACVNTRPIQYVQGHFDTAQLSKIAIQEPVLQRGDLINILVFSDNFEATAIYNLPNATGYLVNDSGRIQMQGVGELKVEGLTKSQVTDLLNSKLTKFLTNPYYSIRFVNYKITLLGEVTREGAYTVQNEKVNIFEAIGLAGGLTIYAKRENVMVIREFNGKRQFARLDLTNPAVFNSPYYFLKQNDLVVVEQTRNKIENSDQTTARNISLATSVISTLIFLYTVFR
ncbi:MAG: polysaccharide biosynthesis/export family protein [Chitinophagaceae bacterium]